MNPYVKALALGGVLLVGGCDSLVDTQPRQSVPPEEALTSLTATQSLLVSAYGRLHGAATYGQRQIIAPEILSDNAAINNNPSGRYRGDSTNEIGTGVGGWTAWYNVLSDVNYVLLGLERIDPPEPVRNRMRGEALFLRALSYHNLARVYAYEPNKAVSGWTEGIIIRNEPVLRIEEIDFRPRSSVEEVYQQIERDLLESITLLTGNPNPRPASAIRYHASRAAAEALLARVYLYWERWADAEARATTAMTPALTSARLATVDQVPTMFRTQPNPESIFEVAINGTNETLGANDAISAIVSDTQWRDVIPSAELLATYAAGDARRTGWYANTTRSATGAFSSKFAESVARFTDHVPVIRFAEMLLIRAEARARQGNAAGALADLNALRAARGAAALAMTVDLIPAVMAERRRELAFEGHRWFDLKRNGMDVPKAARTASATVPYPDFRILAQIPTGQVDLNPNLNQNPGY